jgi:hypothetical protein
VTITIEYSGALCAAGKTEFACDLIAANPGKYLLAVDRREVIATRIQRIESKAAACGTHPVFRPIYSQDEQRFGNGIVGVRRAIREQPTQDYDTPHVVVVCTHEGLISSDLSTYDNGWTLIIDEVPNLWHFGELSCQWTWPIWKEFFGLSPLDDQYAQVTIKRDAPSLEECKRDLLISDEFVDLYRRWESNRPIVKLQSWEDASGGRTWSWHSVWNPDKLDAFDRVIILANSFEDSIAYKLMQHAGAKLVSFPISDNRVWQPRTVRIRFFASQHRAGTTFWTRDMNGAQALGKVETWTAHNTDPENHFWSCNLGNGSLKLLGQKLRPKVSGADGYKHLSCASFIYAAKPSRTEAEALARFGISYDDVVRAREREDLIQFLGRSSWRDPDDGREIDFRVYDQEQALFLKNFIETSGRPFTTILEHVEEAGVDEYRPRPVGAPRKILTSADREAQKERRRKADRESKARTRAREAQEDREAGIERKRGRPTKSPGNATPTPPPSG